VLLRAYTWRIGPIVASTSAFITTTGLPYLESLENHVGAELDRAVDVDDNVDLAPSGTS